ncbi:MULTISPECIES: hypothetical protein [unclassified Ruegeria]|uniref:hypothetical protein n=1 Tax=unclassified Ruegeria TaxID=2625375 RepID=UPI001487C573|nr:MULTISPECIES: hypothetical protein [unclassified Ruegeria]
MRFLPTLILSFVLSLLCGLAHAAGPVSVNPPTARVNGSGESAITLNWRVGVISRAARAVTVTSPGAQLSTGGTIGGPLRRTVQHPGGGLIFVTLSERLVVDRTTAARIAQAGNAVLTRSFTDFNGTSAPATLRMQATSGGPLAVRFADLAFDDDSLFRVVPSGTQLAARLELTTNGRGILDGAWEVAGPSDVAGDFRVVGRVRQVLAGARRATFESPPLPVDRPGIYRVRFVPSPGQRGSFTLSVPDLRYTVTAVPIEPQTPDPASKPMLNLSAPQPGAGLSAATVFSWQPVPNASLYRLEFLDSGAGGLAPKQIAALDTSERSTRLKDFTLDRLRQVRVLRWRVAAFDSAGNLLAVSSVRGLNTTPSQQPVLQLRQ